MCIEASLVTATFRPDSSRMEFYFLCDAFRGRETVVGLPHLLRCFFASERYGTEEVYIKGQLKAGISNYPITTSMIPEIGRSIILFHRFMNRTQIDIKYDIVAIFADFFADIYNVGNSPYQHPNPGI